MSKGQRTYVYLAALVSGLALLFSAVVLSNWAAGQWAVGALYPLPTGALSQPPLTPWLWIGAAALVLWVIHATIAAMLPAKRRSRVWQIAIPRSARLTYISCNWARWACA